MDFEGPFHSVSNFPCIPLGALRLSHNNTMYPSINFWGLLFLSNRFFTCIWWCMIWSTIFSFLLPICLDTWSFSPNRLHICHLLLLSSTCKLLIPIAMENWLLLCRQVQKGTNSSFGCHSIYPEGFVDLFMPISLVFGHDLFHHVH